MRIATILMTLFTTCFVLVSQAQSPIDIQSELDSLYQESLKSKSIASFDSGLKLLAQKSVAMGLDADFEQATHRITALVDGETWHQIQTTNFNLLQSLLRSQGLATDAENNIWFSSNTSLLFSGQSFVGQKKLHVLPFPIELIKLGIDHIGDIDFYQRSIYAPLEDGGNNYKNPYVAIYDAGSFQLKKYYRLPQNIQVEGVPWVAVDPQRRVAYVSRTYYNVDTINIYDLETFVYKGALSLSKTVHNWQGGKVWNGFLYATSDGPTEDGKWIYKINLDTGTVMSVATISPEVHELEGLAFRKVGSNIEIEALGIFRDGTSKWARTLSTRAQLDSFQLSTPSLRDRLIQAINQ